MPVAPLRHKRYRRRTQTNSPHDDEPRRFPRPRRWEERRTRAARTGRRTLRLASVAPWWRRGGKDRKFHSHLIWKSVKLNSSNASAREPRRFYSQRALSVFIAPPSRALSEENRQALMFVRMRSALRSNVAQIGQFEFTSYHDSMIGVNPTRVHLRPHECMELSVLVQFGSLSRLYGIGSGHKPNRFESSVDCSKRRNRSSCFRQTVFFRGNINCFWIHRQE